MKNKKSVIIGIVVVSIIMLFTLAPIFTIDKGWFEARDTMNQYLTERYNEKFSYEKPKSSIDTDGEGKTSTGFYIKTKSKKYPKIDIFTNYVEYVGTIKECWQSVKYAYLLEQDLDELISCKHKLEVLGLKYEYKWDKVFDNYEDYYNSGVNKDTVFYIYIEDKNIGNDIKGTLTNIVNKVPEKMSGKIYLQAVNWKYDYHSFKAIPSGYKLENWDYIELEFSNKKIDWNSMEYNNESENIILKNIK